MFVISSSDRRKLDRFQNCLLLTVVTFGLLDMTYSYFTAGLSIYANPTTNTTLLFIIIGLLSNSAKSKEYTNK